MNFNFDIFSKPSISSIMFLKYMIKSTLLVAFSPLNLIAMLLVTLGIPYLLFSLYYNSKTEKKNEKERKKFVWTAFKRNTGLICVLFVMSLLMNVLFNHDAIVAESTKEAGSYAKVCVFVTQKELDAGISDHDVMRDMDASGCDSSTFPMIKLFWQLTGGGKHPFPTTPKGQWFQRETNDA